MLTYGVAKLQLVKGMLLPEPVMNLFDHIPEYKSNLLLTRTQ